MKVYCVCPVNPAVVVVYVNKIYLSRVPDIVEDVVPETIISSANPSVFCIIVFEINSIEDDWELSFLYLIITKPEPPLPPFIVPLDVPSPLPPPPPPPVFDIPLSAEYSNVPSKPPLPPPPYNPNPPFPYPLFPTLYHV